MNHRFRISSLVFGLIPAVAVLSAVYAAEPDDVVARVGDEITTFRELDTTINSSAMIGIPIPKPGTRERTNMRLTLLDRKISADLLYLDALRLGLDGSPVYRHDIDRFSDAILGSMYREKYLIGELPVSDEEIRDYFKANLPEDTAFTQDVHMAIEAKLRKQRFREKIAAMRGILRKDVEVEVPDDQLSADGDQARGSDEVVARVAGEPVTWGQVRQAVAVTGKDNSPAARRERLEDYIDARIMAQKARAAKLDSEQNFRRRLTEYQKSLLVNNRRAQLEQELEPNDEEVRAFFRDHRDSIAVPAMRKVQMVVVKTQDEAADIKHRIDDGKLTMFQAASEYSIDPNARQTLGELGWVAQGTGFPELDKVTFALQPGEIGGPVESPAGWHLVKVLGEREGEFQDIEDRATWKKAHRQLLKEKEDRYLQELRKSSFRVEVYDDVFSRLTQQEVDRESARQPAADGDAGN